MTVLHPASRELLVPLAMSQLVVLMSELFQEAERHSVFKYPKWENRGVTICGRSEAALENVGRRGVLFSGGPMLLTTILVVETMSILDCGPVMSIMTQQLSWNDEFTQMIRRVICGHRQATFS